MERVVTRFHQDFSSITSHVQTTQLKYGNGSDSTLPHRPWQATCSLELLGISWLSGLSRSTNGWDRYLLDYTLPASALVSPYRCLVPSTEEGTYLSNKCTGLRKCGNIYENYLCIVRSISSYKVDKVSGIEFVLLVVLQTFDGKEGRAKYPRRWVIMPPLLWRMNSPTQPKIGISFRQADFWHPG